MRNIYFDICSIPVFIVLLITCKIRKMTHGRTNRLFLMFTCASLTCAVADFWAELLVAAVPMSRGAVMLASFLDYVYLLLRNASLVLYFIFVFVITRTDYRIRSLKNRLLLWLPYFLLVLILIQNFFTHNVFTVTVRTGYTRGPMISALYLIALIYGLSGFGYCIYCKRYLTAGKWFALLSVYLFTFAAVLIQYLRIDLLVEMFSTALGLLAIMFIVMRPEEAMDASVGLQSWQAYQTDLRNILQSRQPTQIVVIQLTNATEVRTYLSDAVFDPFVQEIADGLHDMFRHKHIRPEMYFERPGTIYLIQEEGGAKLSELIPGFMRDMLERTSIYNELGVQLNHKICVINYPRDLREWKDIINLGHRFARLGPEDQTMLKASDVVSSKHFEVENHMDEILNRAIVEHNVEVYYQPIYDTKTGRFHSAEALARLHDSRYGMISPGIFIPAAEALGLIPAIGQEVLESVYRFIAGHDLKALGLSYIEINLSVAQCMQKNLVDAIRQLQQKYGVDPKTVNLEITETTFNSVSERAKRNLGRLSEMGYTFSLDDYGTGYSNIQRLCRLPFDIIKIDKSMVDEMGTENGSRILHHTVQMMQSIRKKLVAEGAETQAAVEALREMGCDYIQGFYFSKPVPEKEFVAFLEANNR